MSSVDVTGTIKDPYVGPFKSAAGNFYCFGEDYTTGSSLSVVKSSAPSTSWSVISTVTAGNQVTSVNAEQVGDSIHIAVSANGASLSIQYFVFDMATDTFTTNNEQAVASLTAGTYTRSAIAVLSTGTAVIVYNGPTATVMGSSYDRVFYARRVSGVWTTGVAVDAGGTTSYAVGGVTVGASDRVQFLYMAGTTLTSRSLNSSTWTLGTAVSVATSVSVSPPPFPISVNISGTQTQIVLYKHSTNGMTVAKCSDADTPTWSVGAAIAGSGVPTTIRWDDGAAKLYCITEISSALKIYGSSDAGATWDAGASFYSNAYDAEPSRARDCVSYGSNVLAQIFFSTVVNSTFFYGDYTVRVSATYAPPPYNPFRFTPFLVR